MNYELILVPLIAALIAQIIKLIIFAIKNEFSWKNLNSYGGMPSSHSALVTALFAIIGYTQGWQSPEAAISLVLGIIVIRDAGGFRQIIGRHAKELNQIIHRLSPEKAFGFRHLTERIGHTPLQIFFGCLT